MREVMTEILYKEGKGIYGNALVSVTNVRVTSDLSLARFYFSIYNAPSAEVVMAQLNEAQGQLKKALSVQMRSLRKIPQFTFFLDDTLDQAERISKIFDEIKEKDEQIKKENEAQS